MINDKTGTIIEILKFIVGYSTLWYCVKTVHKSCEFIDVCGTGYSFLYYMHSMKVHSVKNDKRWTKYENIRVSLGYWQPILLCWHSTQELWIHGSMRHWWFILILHGSL